MIKQQNQKPVVEKAVSIGGIHNSQQTVPCVGLENNEIPLSLKESMLSLVKQTKPNEDGNQPQTRYQSAHESPTEGKQNCKVV